ncbi:hypothetical protein [Halomonas salipaludis]|uniref:hypothetical protein n=1 Tax=Halomonas salipaludis TaxID=2032625 RepID=UPI001C3EF92E|nr:hypothetical protein [Halomonas salipaludis]
MDKYGTEQAPYCYPQSTTLRNHLGIINEDELISVERELTLLATDAIQFSPPPYDLAYLQSLHHQLFGDLLSSSTLSPGGAISWAWPVKR